MRLAVELAGSGVPAINGIGPLAVAADCGNNAGLVAGPPVPGWQDGAWLDLDCSTEVDGAVVGRGRPAQVEGGPLAAFRFALHVLGSRGRTLRAGDLIATGAITGIHDVVPGQRTRVRFGDLELHLDVVAAGPAAAPAPLTKDDER
jgi:2-keto-4-pentenoate hydratase